MNSGAKLAEIILSSESIGRSSLSTLGGGRWSPLEGCGQGNVNERK